VRKALGSVLVLVGVFALVLAALLRFYAPSRAEKTPLNLDITQVATGPAKVLNSSTGQLEDTTLIATRTVKTDSAASNSKVTVVNESLCIVKNIGNPPPCVDSQDAQGRLVDVTTDRVAADRKSAESVNDPKYGANVNGDTSVQHVGLSYKWPLHAKKTTYKFFDPASGQAPDAKFIGTEKYKGMTLYKYEAVINNIDLPVLRGVPGTYSDTRTVFVDPVTGVIVKGTEVQQRNLANGSLAFQTTLNFNQASIDYQAKQAKDGRSKITMLTVVLPLIGLVVGLAATAGAVLLLRRDDRPGAHSVEAAGSGEPLQRV
jgi:Porin PorA